MFNFNQLSRREGKLRKTFKMKLLFVGNITKHILVTTELFLCPLCYSGI